MYKIQAIIPSLYGTSRHTRPFRQIGRILFTQKLFFSPSILNSHLKFILISTYNKNFKGPKKPLKQQFKYHITQDLLIRRSVLMNFHIPAPND